MRTRQRKVQYGGQLIAKSGGSPPGSNVLTPTYQYSNSVTDEVHKGPPYRSGGPLTVSKTVVKVGLTAPVYTYGRSLPSYYYEGCFYAPVPGVTLPSESSIAGWGAKGWARTIPVSPIANLGVAIGELKDFPRMITSTASFFKRMNGLGLKMSKHPRKVRDIRDAGWDVRNLGDDYLNLQFGWVPFLKDLYGAITFQKALAKKLSQLRRDNGKPVRRNAVLTSENWSTNVSVGQPTFTSLAPIISTFAYPSGAIEPRQLVEEYKLDRWYSAKYRYYIPELADPKADLTRLKLNLLGLSLDPEVIYQLVPWTWLLNWFTNTGAIVHNAVAMARYHVVAEYAYVMQSEMTRYTQAGTHDMYVGTSPNQTVQRLNASSSITRYYRRREAANPYGFGITDASLSAYQWSILVALGLTRLR